MKIADNFAELGDENEVIEGGEEENLEDKSSIPNDDDEGWWMNVKNLTMIEDEKCTWWFNLVLSLGNHGFFFLLLWFMNHMSLPFYYYDCEPYETGHLCYCWTMKMLFIMNVCNFRTQKRKINTGITF